MIGTTFAGETRRRVRPSVPRIGSSFVPAYDNESAPRMSIANMTCDFFTQPLNHFVPRGKSPSFQQRYCIYDGYASNNTTSPILFYTGNESPLEQYINHTGLMWELAPRLNARVVFVEHRYEGQSLPPANLSKDCMSYGSTIQALADYADILQLHLNPRTATDHPIAPVIAFGGSYGGMLSAWMRMKYPHLIAGAIAASAPIGGFPQVANFNLDGSARVLAHGLQQTYPPDKESEEEENHCSSNLLASWPLITWLVQENRNRAFQYEHNGKIENPSSLLQDVFRLCDPYTSSDPEPLVRFKQSTIGITYALFFHPSTCV